MNKLFVIPIIFISLCFLVSGELSPLDKGTVQQNANYNLALGCSYNGTYCSTSFTCNVTLAYPNQSYMFNNIQMSRTTFAPDYNVTINDTSIIGVYTGKQTCCADSLCGDRDFFYTVTFSGAPPIGESQSPIVVSIMAIIAFVSIVLFVFAFMGQNQVAKVTFFCLGTICLVALILYSLVMASDILGQYPALIDGLATFWFIVKIFLWIAFLALLIIIFLVMRKAIKIRRGFE